MSIDVALQVGVKARCGGKEGQTDGHQLPASLQAVVAEVLCGLTTQLDVELITQTLVTPPTHHHLTETSREPGEFRRIAFFLLDKLKIYDCSC